MFFRARKLFKNLNDKISVARRQGRQFLPYHNHDVCKTNQGSKITNWIQVCCFMLKTCNYCMILIIFIVNTSEFAFFFFKSSREATTACAPPTGWLSHWAVCHKLWWWAFAVQLPLCQLCNLRVSYSVMFVCTFNNVLLLYALVFHSLALTSHCV